MIEFNRNPIEKIDGISVYSRTDEYIENYEKISNDHLDHLETHGENPFMSEEYWSQLEDETIVQISPFIQDGDKILDIGVGLGRLLSKIDKDVRKYGVDISLSYLKEAKKKGIEVIKSKIEELPYLDDTFDVIITTDVLEHVFDLNLCVRQIKRVLKPGGLVLVRVPNEEDLAVYLEYEEYKYVHIRNFDKSSLGLLFKKVFEFEIVSTELFGFIRSNQRLTQTTIRENDNISFYDLLLYHFRQGDFDGFGVKEFVSKSFDEYDTFNFRLQNRFLLRQLFKALYYLLRKTQSSRLSIERYYKKVELSMIFKKI